MTDPVTWTSDLSVAELAAVRRCGFDPVGMVLGTTVYQFGGAMADPWMVSPYGVPGQGMGGAFGYQNQGSMYGGYRSGGYAPNQFRGAASGYNQTYYCVHQNGFHPPGYNFEVAYYERSLTDAYRVAIKRMSAEATQLGAHGVVGVRIERRILPISQSIPVNEIWLLGTAIRRAGAEPLPTPFLTHLSGQQFAKLFDRGWIPSGLALGVGAVRSVGGCAGVAGQASSVGDRSGMGSALWSSGEFRQRADAIQSCRRLAVGRMRASVASGSDDRIVGVTLDRTTGASEAGLRFEDIAVGTAVRKFRTMAELAPSRVVLGLADL